MKRTISQRSVITILVLAEFFCTSVWFASNAVMNDLVMDFGLPQTALGHLTSATQLGFITGTLVFALLNIADRFSPSKVFFVSAIIGGAFNLLVALNTNTLFSLLIWRFLTGFFLAGIYPVGMKIAADYFEEGLGKVLGLLVGALVLGTALPHLIKGLSMSSPWRLVILGTSALSALGGLMIYAKVPDGPYRRPSPGFDLSAVFKVFRNKDFRAAAFGYFGHMWELYSFWTFVPFLLFTYFEQHEMPPDSISLLAFIIIGCGGFSCTFGGFLSQRFGLKKTAATALLISGLCCLFSPIFFKFPHVVFAFSFLFIWGLTVIADSPLFSTLVAYNAPSEFKGTALTIVNCIGFTITIISIELLTILLFQWPYKYVFMILTLGPLIGLIALLRKRA